MLKRISVLMLVLGMVACSEYPPLPYYAMDDAIANAETAEEKEFYRTRMREIEDEIEKADEFIRLMGVCDRTTRCMLVCRWGMTPGRLRDPLDVDGVDISDIEKKYRWWKKIRPPTCGFQTDW